LPRLAHEQALQVLATIKTFGESNFTLWQRPIGVPLSTLKIIRTWVIISMDDLYERKYYDRGLFEIDSQLWGDLSEMAMEDVQARCEVSFDPVSHSYMVPLLSYTYCVHPGERRISLHGKILSPAEHFQLHLVLLTYLTQCTLDGPTGQMISEKQLPGGHTFFKGVHALGTDPLVKVFGKDREGFLRMGRNFGGIPEKFGDASFIVRVLPKVPVRFILYAEDEEFPASLKIMFDSSIAKPFKQIDLVWGLFNLAVEHFLRMYHDDQEAES